MNFNSADNLGPLKIWLGFESWEELDTYVGS